MLALERKRSIMRSGLGITKGEPGQQLLYGIWSARPDLQAAFGNTDNQPNWVNLTDWASTAAKNPTSDRDAALLSPYAAYFASNAGTNLVSPNGSNAVSPGTNLMTNPTQAVPITTMTSLVNNGSTILGIPTLYVLGGAGLLLALSLFHKRGR